MQIKKNVLDSKEIRDIRCHIVDLLECIQYRSDWRNNNPLEF